MFIDVLDRDDRSQVIDGIDLRNQLAHQADIEHGAFDKSEPCIAEMMREVVPFPYREVIQNDNLMPRVKQESTR